MKKLFLDLDDTFLETEKVCRNNLIAKGLPVSGSSVYLLANKEGYKEVFAEIFDSYNYIPLKDGAIDSLKLLSTEYEVIFCSSYITEEEKRSKQRFADAFSKNIILCSGDNWDKHNVDMSNGVIIDDDIEVLTASNASVKIQMMNKYKAYGLTFKDYLVGDYLVENLLQAVDILM